jgi:GNAT superfamily N-acetyltransferase
VNEYSLEPLETLLPPAVAEVRRIYEEGFPPHQRAAFTELYSAELYSAELYSAELSDRRQGGEFALALIRAGQSVNGQPANGQPCGFAMLRPLGDTGWVFLRYFVVDHRQRGQGLGGLLWEHLTARLRADGFTLLVFDVDDPAELGHEPDEISIRSRRIGFYQRHGARLLPAIGYRTPHVTSHGTDPEWTPMLLMTARLVDSRPHPADGWARAVVDAVYRYRWQLAPGHPQLTSVLINSQ